MRLRIRVDKATTVTLSSKMVRWNKPSIRMWMRYYDKRLTFIDWGNIVFYGVDNMPDGLPNVTSYPTNPQRVSLDWSKL